MAAAKRLQFNMDMKPIPEVEIMKNMPGILKNFKFFFIFQNIQIFYAENISLCRKVLFTYVIPLPLPEILFPLFWLEESVIIEKQFIDELKVMYWYVVSLNFLYLF